jgi:hypothetical protein
MLLEQELGLRNTLSKKGDGSQLSDAVALRVFTIDHLTKLVEMGDILAAFYFFPVTLWRTFTHATNLTRAARIRLAEIAFDIARKIQQLGNEEPVSQQGSSDAKCFFKSGDHMKLQTGLLAIGYLLSLDIPLTDIARFGTNCLEHAFGSVRRLVLGDNHAERILCKFAQGATIEEIYLSHDIDPRKKAHPNVGGVVVVDDAPGLDDLALFFEGYSVPDLLDRVLRKANAWTGSHEEFLAELSQDLEWKSLTEDLSALRDLVAGTQKAPNDTVLGGKGAFSKIMCVQNDLAGNVERVRRWSPGRLDRLKTDIIEKTQKLAEASGSPPPWEFDAKEIVDDLCYKRTCDMIILRTGLKKCLKDWSSTKSERDWGRYMLEILIRFIDIAKTSQTDQPGETEEPDLAAEDQQALTDTVFDGQRGFTENIRAQNDQPASNPKIKRWTKQRQDALEDDITARTQSLIEEMRCNPPWNVVDGQFIVDELCERHNCDVKVLGRGLERCRDDWQKSGSGGFQGYVINGLISVAAGNGWPTDRPGKSDDLVALENDIIDLTRSLIKEKGCEPPWNDVAGEFIVNELCERHHCDVVHLCRGLAQCLDKWQKLGLPGFAGYVMTALIGFIDVAKPGKSDGLVALENDIIGLTRSLIDENGCLPPWNDMDGVFFVDKLCKTHHCDVVHLCSGLAQCLDKWQKSGLDERNGQVTLALISLIVAWQTCQLAKSNEQGGEFE